MKSKKKRLTHSKKRSVERERATTKGHRKLEKTREKTRKKKGKEFREKAKQITSSLRHNFKEDRFRKSEHYVRTKKVLCEFKTDKQRALDKRHLEKLSMALNILSDVIFVGKSIHRDTLFIAENTYLSMLTYAKLLMFPEQDAVMYRRLENGEKVEHKLYRGDFSNSKIIKLQKKATGGDKQ